MSDFGTAATPLWKRPFVIVMAALALRLAWAACIPVDPVSDGALYDAFARSIAAGRGYAFPDGTSTEYWPVGTSAVYSLLYSLFGVRPWVIPAFQSLLGAYIVALTWRIARQSTGSRTVAAAAAWLTAAWPLLIEFTTIFASELLFIALILTALDLWASRRLPFVPRMVCWSAVIAAATYVRPTALLLLFIFPAVQWIADRDLRALFMGLMLSLATASLLFAPWSYRSLVLFDRFVLVSANGGVNLWMGNNPASSGGYMDLPDKQFANEVDRDHYYGGQATAFILSHPVDYAKLSLRRTAITYGRETIGVAWNEKGIESKYRDGSLTTLKRISSAYWWMILSLGLVGTWMAIRRLPLTRLWPLLAAFAYLGAFPIFTVAMDRYHVPIDPMLAVFAAYAMFGNSAPERLRRASAQELESAA